MGAVALVYVFVCATHAPTGQKQHSVLSMVTNLLGTAMLVLGIACIVRGCVTMSFKTATVLAQMVAGSLPVNGWEITIAGYVILTTFGTIFIGFSAVVSPGLMLMYKREANALQVLHRVTRVNQNHTQPTERHKAAGRVDFWYSRSKQHRVIVSHCLSAEDADRLMSVAIPTVPVNLAHVPSSGTTNTRR